MVEEIITSDPQMTAHQNHLGVLFKKKNQIATIKILIQ